MFYQSQGGAPAGLDIVGGDFRGLTPTVTEGALLRSAGRCCMVAWVVDNGASTVCLVACVDGYRVVTSLVADAIAGLLGCWLFSHCVAGSVGIR